MSDDLRMGIYRHYKGALYQVLGLGHDANADTLGDSVDAVEHDGGWSREVVPLGERVVVVYVPLELDAEHLGPRLAVRTLEDFLAWVRVDATVAEERFRTADRQPGDPRGYYVRHMISFDGWEVPRFEYLGPVLTAEMVEARNTTNEHAQSGREDDQ